VAFRMADAVAFMPPYHGAFSFIAPAKTPRLHYLSGTVTFPPGQVNLITYEWNSHYDIGR
jgi:hypothetical protein